MMQSSTMHDSNRDSCSLSEDDVHPTWQKHKVSRNLCNAISGALIAAVAILLSIAFFVKWTALTPMLRMPLSKGMIAGSFSGSDSLLDTVLNETLGFQKILVINVPSRSDRRDAMALAASLSGIKVEFLNAATEVDLEKAFPHKEPGYDMSDLPMHTHASWRSHVNAIRTIVEQDLGSALILEDDADWDVRIKEQLRDWAKATQLLLQPVTNSKSSQESFLDPTCPPGRLTTDEDPYTSIEFDHPERPIVKPTSSAYGDLDRWDVLWAGHCGQMFAHPNSNCPATPLGRVLMHDDPTVAQTQHFFNYWSGREYAETQENHTRVTHFSCGQVCNTAYAVSRRGAEKLLYEFGMNHFHGMSDQMLKEICQGTPPYTLRNCISVSPPLFNQIDVYKSPMKSRTPNIRLSVKANADLLVNGITNLTELYDSFPDE